ncbi:MULTISPECIES: ISL3 family transposase [Aurantimonadaceae]|uniref:ISL3 family transposase n=1 Tax=Jiella pelagia TaxID=2986949 RepID=A0ABY7C690_9HYPH|nr:MULTISPECIES: ISL3 family transposase [Aurantimonadaceae]ORE97104.1 transposase IS204/IS1001/IS1096/IS1165 family protein [Aurantimonas sp. 22II-16-19i]WAP71469.1 ISL3 family transposase [Jiella pelagia]
MPHVISLSSLIPAGLTVEQFEAVDDVLIVTASGRNRQAACPSCSSPARRVHSRYIRGVTDLPAAGRMVRLRLITRRFRCDVGTCRRKIFAERFGEAVPERARRTGRMECIVHHLGLALGGRPAASFAERLMMPVSNDTLLRVVRRRARPRNDVLTTIGIDDFAFRRNHRYGSIVCDLQRRQIVKLLPDREIATVAAWLADHPDIRIVSRDRGGGYGEAAALALPEVVQVADRWHLMENASAAFLDAVRKSMKLIRVTLGATAIDPKLLTSAERIQYEGYLRREETNGVVEGLAADGIPIKEIVRRTGRSRKLVRQIVRGERTDVFRTRQGSLDPHLPYLDAQWEAGCRNGAELWRRLRGQGFLGSLRVVGEWATRRRRSEHISGSELRRTPSARTIARLMTLKRDHLTKSETVVVAAIEAGVPALAEARELTDRFHAMIRGRAVGDLVSWMHDAEESLLASFARGILKDASLSAVQGAIIETWSNGQTEGQVNKLKLVKRQMYGRAKLDLLEARLLGAA